MKKILYYFEATMYAILIGLILGGFYWLFSSFLSYSEERSKLENLERMACNRANFPKKRGGNKYLVFSQGKYLGKEIDEIQAVLREGQLLAERSAQLGFVFCVEKHDVLVEHCYYSTGFFDNSFDVPILNPTITVSLIDLHQSKVLAKKVFEGEVLEGCKDVVKGTKRNRFYGQTYGEIDTDEIIIWMLYRIRKNKESEPL